jgi:hypothetical protein
VWAAPKLHKQVRHSHDRRCNSLHLRKLISPAINQPFRNLMPSSNLPQRFLLTERFFHNLVALRRRPPTRLGHWFLPAVPSLSMAISLSPIQCSESGGTRQGKPRILPGAEARTQFSRNIRSVILTRPSSLRGYRQSLQRYCKSTGQRFCEMLIECCEGALECKRNH